LFVSKTLLARSPFEDCAQFCDLSPPILARSPVALPDIAPRSSGHIMFFMQDAKLVIVQSYGSRPEADLARGALEDAGIQALVQADTAGGMREHLAWSGAGFKILVREEDAAVARDVLTSPAEGEESPDADFETDRDPQPPWRRFT